MASAHIPRLALPQARHILFAGTTVNYAADEVAIVAALGRLLAGHHETRDVAVFYRPHPRQSPERIAPLKGSPGVIIDPAWVGGWDPKPSSIPRIKTLCQTALLTVSAFSTVVLEAALCGTPSVLIGFGGSAHGTGKALDHLKFEHMAEMIGKPGITVAEDMASLVRQIRAAASGCDSVESGRIRSWALQIADVSRDPRENMIQWLCSA